MVERQLPKLHTGVRFPSPADFMGKLQKVKARVAPPEAARIASRQSLRP
jgi:hypothetical protein